MNTKFAAVETELLKVGDHPHFFEICVIGSLNIDLSVFTSRYPKTGETVFGSSFLLGFGGKGSNQAAAANSLGGKVSFVGKVGSDDFGKRLKEHMRKIGVNIDGIGETTSDSTGVAFIEVEEGSGQNRIIVAPGANMLLSREDVELFFASGLLNTRVAVFQFEISAATTLRGLQLAKEKNLLTIVNPAPILDPNQSEQRELLSLIPSILALADFCCPNETEAAVLAQHHIASWSYPVAEELPLCAYTPVLCWLAEKGVGFPIVTLGRLGLVALLDRNTLPVELAGDVQLLECRQVNGSERSVLHIPAPKIQKVVDTTGAGDYFVGALAYFVACHPKISLVEQLRRSVWVASQSVKAAGTQLSYPANTSLPRGLFSNDNLFLG